MKLIDVKIARLHNPVLVSGTNLGVTLDPTKRTGLKCQVDIETNTLYIVYNGEVSVETTNLSGYIPINPEDIGFLKLEKPKPVREIVKTAGSAPMRRHVSDAAQVETPHGLNRNKL